MSWHKRIQIGNKARKQNEGVKLPIKIYVASSNQFEPVLEFAESLVLKRIFNCILEIFCLMKS